MRELEISKLWNQTKFEKVEDIKRYLVNGDKKRLWNLMQKANNPFNVFGKFMAAKARMNTTRVCVWCIDSLSAILTFLRRSNRCLRLKSITLSRA